jgi:hypothetical protein
LANIRPFLKTSSSPVHLGRDVAVARVHARAALVNHAGNLLRSGAARTVLGAARMAIEELRSWARIASVSPEDIATAIELKGQR